MPSRSTRPYVSRNTSSSLPLSLCAQSSRWTADRIAAGAILIMGSGMAGRQGEGEARMVYSQPCGCDLCCMHASAGSVLGLWSVCPGCPSTTPKTQNQGHTTSSSAPSEQDKAKHQNESAPKIGRSSS